MREIMRILFLVALFVYAVPSARSQQPVAAQNPKGISMKSVEALGQSGTGPKVIGGRPARSSDWRASFYSSIPGARCTAQLVGPTALLLAAHCVGDGFEASIEVDGKMYTGVCTQADDYRNDASADYALCKMTVDVPGIPFENVNIDPKLITKGSLLLLTGYGCTKPGGVSDGVFRLADAAVSQLPGEKEPNSIITQDKTAICPGDSGGGAFIVWSARKRVVVSVNSRVVFTKGESYLSSLSTTAAIAFLTKWSAQNGGAKICGFNQSGDPCR
jgi:Trypsin